ncbi:hypothetical protein N9901_02250 [Flavobacteriaceae bacterium]|nr:hypothetical protein [Flavobacteriaceae bacterium]
MKYFFLFISLILFSCSEKEVHYMDNTFYFTKGTLLKNKQPFTGTLMYTYGKNKEAKKYERYYSNGVLDGTYKKWYKNGQLAEDRLYKEGKRTGTHKGWWENGQLRFLYNFNENGEYKGEVTEWYKDGKVFKIYTYINGSEEGPQRMWDEDGEFVINYIVKNGERYGRLKAKGCDAKKF